MHLRTRACKEKHLSVGLVHFPKGRGDRGPREREVGGGTKKGRRADRERVLFLEKREGRE